MESLKMLFGIGKSKRKKRKRKYRTGSNVCNGDIKLFEENLRLMISKR